MSGCCSDGGSGGRRYGAFRRDGSGTRTTWRAARPRESGADTDRHTDPARYRRRAPRHRLRTARTTEDRPWRNGAVAPRRSPPIRSSGCIADARAAPPTVPPLTSHTRESGGGSAGKGRRGSAFGAVRTLCIPYDPSLSSVIFCPSVDHFLIRLSPPWILAPPHLQCLFQRPPCAVLDQAPLRVQAQIDVRAKIVIVAVALLGIRQGRHHVAAVREMHRDTISDVTVERDRETDGEDTPRYYRDAAGAPYHHMPTAQFLASVPDKAAP